MSGRFMPPLDVSAAFFMSDIARATIAGLSVSATRDSLIVAE
jgi:hypothetical protein